MAGAGFLLVFALLLLWPRELGFSVNARATYQALWDQEILEQPLVENLRTVRSAEAAVDLLRLLRYDARALPYDGSVVGLDGSEALRLRSDPRSPARGYGILVAELERAPRSLRTLGRRLVEELHDRPLALVGLRNGDREWSELLVIRPRLIPGGGGAVSIRKLTIDVGRPTAHDAEVVRGLRWEDGDDAGTHARIDQALDVERVTRRFFAGLSEHHERLLAALRAAAERESAVLAGLELAGGAERVALRIVTQVLFCYFVQRKGLLEGERGWLSLAFQRNLPHGSYYQRVLEPLFYEALSTPPAQRPAEWRRTAIPFLNGGLFERHYGEVSLRLPDELFSTEEGLLGFLDGWTFTVAEEVADESEVAVDPEMLGRVFENLISEEEMRREGTVYTPRPVVQLMCREGLVPYLMRKAELSEDDVRELLISDEAVEQVADERGADEALELARRIEHAVTELRAIDPAVGSGAFLLGLMGELIRLRRLAHFAIHGTDPDGETVHGWRLALIERSLFGVDVNPTAIELCRLRLWLSLLTEESAADPRPLPNLQYRTLCADSLRDFVGGVEIQQTRSGELTLGLDLDNPAQLLRLRERYFETADPSVKERLRDQLATAEDRVVSGIFDRVQETALQSRRGRQAQAEAEATLRSVPALRSAFASRDRVFPAFLPTFSAPDVTQAGGWDLVIMNPPYVERKLVRQRFDAGYLADLERHYERTSDLMIHFGRRAFELAHPQHGTVSMIFNDSIFTSADADELRRQLLDPGGRTHVLAAARTRCFEGQAVNGGVIVATRQDGPSGVVRWVENHGRPPADLAGASRPAEPRERPETVGASELWVVPRADYLRLPHRPLFRPSAEARRLLGVFERCAAWDDLSRWDGASGDWQMLSETARLERWKQARRRSDFYERLPESDGFVLLGLVVQGGQGLATADDRRFLAAIEGTREAREAEARRERLAQLVLESATSLHAFTMSGSRQVASSRTRYSTSRSSSPIASSAGRRLASYGQPRQIESSQDASAARKLNSASTARSTGSHLRKAIPATKEKGRRAGDATTQSSSTGRDGQSHCCDSGPANASLIANPVSRTSKQRAFGDPGRTVGRADRREGRASEHERSYGGAPCGRVGHALRRGRSIVRAMLSAVGSAWEISAAIRGSSRGWGRR